MSKTSSVLLCNTEALGKARSITYSECVYLALDILHVKYMRIIILPSVTCLTVPYFSTVSYERHYFRGGGGGGGGVFEHRMLIFIFCSTFFSETFLILRRIERDIVINICEYSLFLLDFSETVIFSADFRKVMKYKIS